MSIEIDGFESRDLPTRFVNDLLHESTDVTISLGKVERSERSWCNSVFLVSPENTTTLTLIPDDCE